ncbi:MAG TPA: fumarylacetoacetate hydrolase family protein [Thermoleophilia bacterium]|jgi:2-keto-4-pentenoate hydratase/2-oxohepta-3-ene-1,7-dioic acid hydratase in catechol pathway
MKIARIEYQGEVYTALVTCAGYLLNPGFGAGSSGAARGAEPVWSTGEGHLQPGSTIPEQDATILAPAVPGKILGVGWNFRAHIKEMADRLAGDQVPEQPKVEEVPPPVLFFKPSSSLIGHRQAIVYPREATRVEYEGELAVVIARDTRRVTPEEAKKAVLGWTCANDVTERDQQGTDKQWWRAKGYDTFAVAGPYLETEMPAPDAWIRTRVNGQLRQEGQVRDMIRDPFEIISLVSQAMTLQRGDMIMLGTPPGVGELHPGDEVEVEIDGVGFLKNPVRAEEE